MKKNVKLSLLAVVSVTIAVAACLPALLPLLLTRILTAEGFPDARVARAAYTAQPPGLTIENLTLGDTDASGFSRADISFLPFGLKITGLTLALDLATGEEPVLAGRRMSSQGNADKSGVNIPPLFPSSIILDKARLRLVTKQAAVDLDLDAQSTLSPQGILAVKGIVRARDPALTLDAAFEAERKPSGDINGTARIRDTGFALPAGRGNDISSDIKFFMPGRSDIELEITATAQSLTLADIPFINAELTYKGAGQNQKIQVKTATGDKAAKITADVLVQPTTGDKLAFSGILRADGRDLEKISKQLSGSGKLGLSFDGLQNADGSWEKGRGKLEASFQKLTLGALAKNVQGEFSSDITATPDGMISARTETPVRLSSDAGVLEIPASAAEPIILRLDTAQKDRIGFSGALGKLARFKGAHDTATRSGHADITVPAIEFTPARQPASLWPPLAKLAEDVQGSLGGDAVIEWNAKGLKTSRGHVLIKNMAATFNGVTAEGVNAVIALESLSPPRLTGQTVSIARLDAGLPLTEGLLRFSLDGQKLDVAQMDWALAKGSLGLEAPFALDLGKQSATLALNAHGLDLAELFALADMDGLTATGLLSGRIPVRLDGPTVTIDNGVLETSEPGVIRYDPKDPPSFLENPVAGGVIDFKSALKNFAYESLKMTVNGAAGGEQEILLSVRGKNPDFYNGSPVSINLNLGGALDKVLKYNLGTHKIPDAIQKQIEDYEKAKSLP